MMKPKRILGVSLDPATRARVLELMERLGEAQAARVLHLSPVTMTRAALGLSLHRATVTQIEVSLPPPGEALESA